MAVAAAKNEYGIVSEAPKHVATGKSMRFVAGPRGPANDSTALDSSLS